jgi:hypothetical protein
VDFGNSGWAAHVHHDHGSRASISIDASRTYGLAADVTGCIVAIFLVGNDADDLAIRPNADCLSAIMMFMYIEV